MRICSFVGLLRIPRALTDLHHMQSYSYAEAGMIEIIGWFVEFVPFVRFELTFLHSLVGYFVVFNAAGFSPRDLQRAQKASTLDDPIVYFLADSPDFVTSAGRIIVAADQAIAWGQANSIMYIGVCQSIASLFSSTQNADFFPRQSLFSVSTSVRLFRIVHEALLILLFCRRIQGEILASFRSTSRLELLQFRRYPCWSRRRHVHHLHSESPRSSLRRTRADSFFLSRLSPLLSTDPTDSPLCTGSVLFLLSTESLLTSSCSSFRSLSDGSFSPTPRFEFSSHGNRSRKDKSRRIRDCRCTLHATRFVR